MTARWPLALPPAVLALLGGLLLLARPSLWYDELYTAVVAPQPLSALVEAVRTGQGSPAYLEQVPPSYNAPYYAVVHGWLALTGAEPGELSLRSLSLLAAVGGTALLTVAVARLAGRAAAVVAGLLVATNPLVLEYAVEARGYGLAVLAVGAAALGLARWLDGSRPVLWTAAALLAGLAHWFALPVVAGLALAALLLRRRAAVPLLGLTALAALPTLGLVALASAVDEGRSTTGWIAGAGLAVPWQSLQAWASKSPPLLVVTLAAAALALRRRDRTAVVAGCWVLVPVAVVVLAELLVRPVFVPRYLLPALLGLAVLAGAGLASLRRYRTPAVAVALLASLFASAPLATRPPRDDARGAVEALAAAHRPGEPVVAVDRRAAVSLEVYADEQLRADLLLPPDDAPAGQDVVWLLRHEAYATGLAPSDDDRLLAEDGLRLVRSWRFEGSSAVLVVQRWER